MMCLGSRFVLAIVSLLAAAAARGATAVPETISGRVFLDANENGRLDPGEQGLAGIRVTDSMQIVETAADGSYTITIADDHAIPHRPAQCVAVNWPSYKWPTGRWWRRLSEITEGESVDFGLREDKQELPYCFIHVSDNHDAGGIYPSYAAEVKRMLPMARFIVNTGDLSYAATNTAADIFSNVVERGASLPLPVFYTIGNHDVSPGVIGDGPGQHPLAGFGGYTKYLGPPRWSFDYAGSHFVGIDWEGNPGPWFAEDMKRVKAETTVFGFVHYRSGLHGAHYVFYGHVHVQEQRKPHLSSVINLSGNGGCTLGIVHQNGVDVVERCSGCKAGQPRYHSRRRCRLRQLSYRLIPALTPRRRDNRNLGATVLNDSTAAIKMSAGKPIEIDLVLSPGSAKRAGLRIGDNRILEIALDGALLEVGGVPIPFIPREEQTDVTMHLLLENGTFDLYVNDLIHFSKPYDYDTPAVVTFFADGGQAEFKSVDVWELQ